MNRIEAIALLVVVGIASWIVATALPAWSEVAWGGGVILILATALASLTARAAAMRHARQTPFQSLLKTYNAKPARPEDLEKIERLASWGAYSEHDFSHRLKPIIVSLIRRRILISRGIELTDDEEPPPGLLSPELTALIAPSGAPRTTSITTKDLNQALDEIEAL
jgi:hypothetical protein